MEQDFEQTRVQSDDLQYVVGVVNSKLNTYDIQVNPLSVRFFYFNSDNPNLFESFDQIRLELVPKGYIPFLSQNGEHYLEVSRRPPAKYYGNYVNLAMLVLTLLSTIYVGSTYAAYFTVTGASLWTSLLYGFLFFSLPLMLILGIHETGHYIVAKRHKVKASLPFFIPFPVMIGTFGAFISLRDPVPNRRAMVEIGIAGPLFGFLTALPLLFLASYLSHMYVPIPNSHPNLLINYPIIYNLLHIPITSSSQPVFPMVLAVWVGMFATAMNLIPVGQLDGGHVARGLLGKRASIVDYIFVAFLFVVGYYYNGWWLLAIFVVFMGLNHPPALDDYSPIRGRQVAFGLIGLLMFVLTFTVIPISPPRLP